MSNETLFYICGGVLAVSAVTVSFVGLKLKNFPGKFLPVIILWFAVFVVSATAFATRYSGEEHEKKAAEYARYFEEAEKGKSSSSFGNEGAAEGGESKEAEEAAEGSEEPVGPTENETGKKPSNKGGETSGNKEAGGGASTTLQLEASETELAFDTTQLTAKAGKVTIDFTNPSALEHNVVIEQNGNELAGFEPIAEAKESETANLKPGTYTFFCSVPGHREAGMEGTLTVE